MMCDRITYAVFWKMLLHERLSWCRMGTGGSAFLSLQAPEARQTCGCLKTIWGFMSSDGEHKQPEDIMVISLDCTGGVGVREA